MKPLYWILLTLGLVTLPSMGSAQNSRTVLFSAMATGPTDVAEISVQNVRVTVGKKPVRVVSVTQARAPGHLVIALDASGSLREKRKWDAELLAAREVLKSLDTSWKVTIMPFSYGADTDFPQSNRDELIAKLNEMSMDPSAYVKGPSQIRDATIIAIKVYKLRNVDAVLLLTDGLDNASNLPSARFLEMMLKPQVRVFAGIITESPNDLRRAGTLMQTLRGSGGMTAVLKVPEFDALPGDPLHTKEEKGKSPELVRGVTDLLSAIMQSSTAELDLSPAASGDLRVEILNTQGRPAKNLIVLAPQEIFAADSK